MPTVADVLLQGIKMAGGVRLFGVPGGGSSLELLAAARRCHFPFVLCHQETAACIMAAVTGELTGAPGAALVAVGPGAASAVNGVAYAWLDRSPLIVFTDRHTEDVRAFNSHQAIDQSSLYSSVTKASWVVDFKTAQAQVSKAVEMVLTDPLGPVHLELSADVANTCASESGQVKSQLNTPSDLELSGIERAAERIRTSERPVLLVGLQCRDEEDRHEIRELAMHLQAPVLTTCKAKGALSEEHPLHAGIFTGASIERSVVGMADVLVAIGLDPVELIPRTWVYDSPVIHISRERSSPRYYCPEVALLGQPGRILRKLSSLIGPGVVSKWNNSMLAQLKNSTIQELQVPVDGLAPHRVAELCRKRTPRNTIAVVDSGAHMFPMIQFWTATEPRSFLISNGLATMGFALPAAIAAQLVHPNRRVLCFTGDGGLMMVVAEMETVMRLGLPIIVVVFNDHRLSLIQIKQEQKGYGNADMSYIGPDFTALAQSFGWASFTVATEVELQEALNAALAATQPTLIDARIDSSGYRHMLEKIRGTPMLNTGKN